jgi:hypothetical protein
MSHHHHPFDALCYSAFCLADCEQESALADWLVVYATHKDDGLFFQTNAEALVLALVRVFGDDTARLALGFYGEKLALLAPDAPAAARAAATAYTAEMAAGQHLDLAVYHQAQQDKCAERWNEMALPDRFQMVKDLRGSVRLALPNEPPALVMPTLMQTFE